MCASETIFLQRFLKMVVIVDPKTMHDFLSNETARKPSPSRPARALTQTPRLWEKNEKYIGPFLVAMPNHPPKGFHKRQPKNPHWKNEQSRHEVDEDRAVKKKTIPRWWIELKRNKPEPKKHRTNRNTKIRKARTEKNNQSKESRHKLDRKKVLFKTPKQK